jgi:hypothetical protein
MACFVPVLLLVSESLLGKHFCPKSWSEYAVHGNYAPVSESAGGQCHETPHTIPLP